MFVLIVFVFVGVFGQKGKNFSSLDLLLDDKSAGIYKIGASLFTLIGAGEIIALSTLGFLFGRNGVFLFLGYFAAFIFLGLLAPKIRALPATQGSKSIVEFSKNHIGPWFGWVVLTCSFAAFFSLLMLQFSAIGAILPDQNMVSRSIIIVLVALAIYVYLSKGGGLGSVFRTDIFQSILMITLMGVVLLLFINSPDLPQKAHKFEIPPFSYTWGLLISGFFVGIVSADVWQRMFAAKSNSSARTGFIMGAFILLVYGFVITEIGVLVANSYPLIDSSNTFFHALKIVFPGAMSLLGIGLLLSALISTADTEIFVLTTMLVDKISQYSSSYKAYLDKFPLKAVNIVLLSVTLLSAGCAIFADNLLQIYTWLLYALISISPVFWLSIIKPIPDRLASITVIINWAILAEMIAQGFITIDTVYYYVIPCLLTGIVAFIVSCGIDRAKKN
ncbi:MAG: hypothetical protein K8R67_03810 [Desulfobacteraceae bacterium]|nr:hypothetical protein [Desulfobacteraceae bacterium]